MKMKYEIGINQAIIVSGHNRYQPFVGAVGIVGDKIVEVREGILFEEECEKFIDGTGKILMPGLVNGHCHGDMTLARGMGDDLTLLEQNEAFADTGWFYSLIDDEDRFYSRQLTYCEALLSGTTFIMENMYWGLGLESIRAMSEVGIRGALAEDVRVDFSNPNELIPEEDIDAFIDTCSSEKLIPILGSISEEDYSIELLNRIKSLAGEKKVLVTCHLAENTWRREIVKERFGKTAIEFLYQNELLGKEILGSHVVYATEEEISMLAKTGTKVINTPLCEMKIEDGIAPISQMIREGVTVCLGTDGAMWNNSNDIFREMKGMSLIQTMDSGIRSLDKRDILDMATINGAKCFGLEQDYGTIEVGKKADFILIETRVPHMQPLRIKEQENVTSSLIYNATGRDVTDVFVNGNHVVENRVIRTVDITYIMNKVQKSSNKIAKALSS